MKEKHEDGSREVSNGGYIMGKMERGRMDGLS